MIGLVSAVLAAPAPHGPPPAGFCGPIRRGGLVLAVFFAGLGGWAALAPLDSATVAPGSVVVDTQRKTIQHLEGGIVREILARDGERVLAGQVLIALDDTQARAALEMVQSRYDNAIALVARLTAEQLDRKQIDFPAELRARSNVPEVAKIINVQKNIFRTKLDELDSQTAILNQRSAQALEEIAGLKDQIKAEREQLRLLDIEIGDVEYLLGKGLIQKPRLLQLQRERAEVEGAMDQNIASIARTRQAIGENQMRILELHTNRLDEAAKQRNDALKDMFEFADRLRAARDVVDRTLVVAPIDGFVMNMSVHTVGGVVRPGEALMDIVPARDPLVIEARLDPKDVQDVHAGLPAQLRLTGFNRRTTPTLDGRVIWVSADRIDDEKQHASYYTARVVPDANQLAQSPQIELYPGMPVDVMITTGRRTALDYLLTPVSRTFAHAMREK